MSACAQPVAFDASMQTSFACRGREPTGGLITRLLYRSVGALLMCAYNAAMADMYMQPVPMVYPDTPPVNVAFYFPGGGPLERFTGHPDNWYGVFRAFMAPGSSYAIVFCHEGDPARVRLHALDGNPLHGVVQSHVELRPARADFVLGPCPAYDVLVRLPHEARTPYVYLMLEWQAPAGEANHPLPVLLQVVSIFQRHEQMGRGRRWWWPFHTDSVTPPSPLQSRRPVELPFPVWTPPWEQR